MDKYSLFFRTFLAGLRKEPMVMSFDVTSKCNLNCPGCFWQTHKSPQELTREEAVTLFTRLRVAGIVHCTYVGGEPLLRVDLVRELANIIPFNWVVTNGSRDIPVWKDVQFLVSVDGIGEDHDRTRRCPGLFDALWGRIRDRGDIVVTTTLFSHNVGKVTDIVDTILGGTSVKGITVNFATPMRGIDRDIFVSSPERIQALQVLDSLKRRWGRRLFISPRWLRDLHPQAVSAWYTKCPVKHFNVSYGSDGTVKTPCVLGNHAVCSLCGCHVPAVIRAALGGDWETWRILFRMLY